MRPLRTARPDIRQVLHVLFFIALALGLLWYLNYQARSLLTGPEIMLSYEPSPVQHERSVTLEGMVHNVTLLTVNGNPIFTDEEGRFEKRLVLENGYTIMTVRATDRFGRETSLSRSFVYTPKDTL